MLNINANINKGDKMIKLTDKETKLVQVLIDNNDDTHCHCISEQYFNQQGCEHRKLGWSFTTLKGVLGSIINKRLLTYDQTNEHWDWFKFYVEINPSIKTSNDYVNALQKQLIEEKA